MKYIKGNDRNQIALIPTTLEEAIDENNEVRIIDLFVDSLDLATMDFRLDFVENGRPAYHPSDLLKLFLYQNSFYLPYIFRIFIVWERKRF